jgi:cytochrome d ubiquinol oxidase subunit II
MDFNAVWFLLIYVLLIGYAILDGFDLGVGMLHLFGRGDQERRIQMNAIGPVWDGNEVWILAGGGALFAAFPPVYAAVFSGFYLALMLLLVALIFRAVSFEFRGKVGSPGWRAMWDGAFSFGSLVAALLFGVAFGNILRGVPIDADQHWAGSFLGLLNPYALLIGVTGLVLLAMHGAAYLTLKTEGALHDRVQRWVPRCWVVFVLLYVAAVIATFFAAPHVFESALGRPLFWVFAVLAMAAIVYTPVAHRAGREFQTLLATSATIGGAMGLAAVGLFPRLVPSTIDAVHSLTCYNASSTELTLKAMFTITLVGMPLVLTYTAIIYWVFRGKVKLGEFSY